jgi:hypothetical protein
MTCWGNAKRDCKRKSSDECGPKAARLTFAKRGACFVLVVTSLRANMCMSTAPMTKSQSQPMCGNGVQGHPSTLPGTRCRSEPQGCWKTFRARSPYTPSGRARSDIRLRCKLQKWPQSRIPGHVRLKGGPPSIPLHKLSILARPAYFCILPGPRCLGNSPASRADKPF